MHNIAQQNFERHLRQNAYPGRGLVVGRGDDGAWLILYWIMGRSPNSRNRHFVAQGSTLRTEAVDPSLLADPSLIIYEAMLDLPGVYLVSNGDQTRTIYDSLQAGGSFDAALQTREREPDAPNYTPRISGMVPAGRPPPADPQHSQSQFARPRPNGSVYVSAGRAAARLWLRPDHLHGRRQPAPQLWRRSLAAAPFRHAAAASSHLLGCP